MPTAVAGKQKEGCFKGILIKNPGLTGPGIGYMVIVVSRIIARY